MDLVNYHKTTKFPKNYSIGINEFGNLEYIVVQTQPKIFFKIKEPYKSILNDATNFEPNSIDDFIEKTSPIEKTLKITEHTIIIFSDNSISVVDDIDENKLMNSAIQIVKQILEQNKTVKENTIANTIDTTDVETCWEYYKKTNPTEDGFFKDDLKTSVLLNTSIEEYSLDIHIDYLKEIINYIIKYIKSELQSNVIEIQIKFKNFFDYINEIIVSYRKVPITEFMIQLTLQIQAGYGKFKTEKDRTFLYFMIHLNEFYDFCRIFEVYSYFKFNVSEIIFSYDLIILLNSITEEELTEIISKINKKAIFANTGNYLKTKSKSMIPNEVINLLTTLYILNVTPIVYYCKTLEQKIIPMVENSRVKKIGEEKIGEEKNDDEKIGDESVFEYTNFDPSLTEVEIKNILNKQLKLKNKLKTEFKTCIATATNTNMIDFYLSKLNLTAVDQSAFISITAEINSVFNLVGLIKQKIKEKMRNTLLTYVKFNDIEYFPNDLKTLDKEIYKNWIVHKTLNEKCIYYSNQKSEAIYFTGNSRFQVSISSDETNKIIGFNYVDVSSALYDNSLKFLTNTNQETITNTDKDQILKIAQLYCAPQTIINGMESDINRSFTLGNFTNVFSVSDNNQTVSDKIFEDIRENLLGENPKPIFLMGYGSSGSGKTSTLIYLNKNGENGKGVPGLILNILNKPEIKQAMGNNATISVDIYEFYEGIDNSEKASRCRDVIFQLSNDDFVLMTDIKKYVPKHHYRLKHFKTENLLRALPTLQEFLIYMIDKDRFTKATPNNPMSSRSHIILSVTLNYTNNKKGRLFIGDFAGIENTFDFDSIETVQQFLLLKRDTSVGMNTSKNPLYYFNECFKKENTIFLDTVANETKSDEICLDTVANETICFFTTIPDDPFDFICFNENTLKTQIPKIISSLGVVLNKTYILQILQNASESTITSLFSSNNVSTLEYLKNTSLFSSNNVSTLEYLKKLQKELLDACLPTKNLHIMSKNDVDNLKYSNDQITAIQNKYNFNNLTKTQKLKKENLQNFRNLYNKYNSPSSYNKQKRDQANEKIQSITFDIKDINVKIQKIDKLTMIDRQTRDTLLLKYETDATKKNKDQLNTKLTSIQILVDKIIILVYGIHIVYFRGEEGKYINGSIKRIREQIVDIIQYKNKGSTFVLPDYYFDADKSTSYSCKYCKNQNNYCLINSSADYKKAEQIVTETGYKLERKNVIKQYGIMSVIKTAIMGQDNDSFCNDILFGILCVFNMSRKADPPKIPYLNINDLKKDFQKIVNKYRYATSSFHMSNKLTDVNYFNLKVTELQKLCNYYKTNDFVNELIITKQEEYKEIKEDKDTFLFLYDTLITNIENHNESTSIGSLEFIDRMSKLNRVNVMCLGTEHNKNKMQPLYNEKVKDIISRNGSKKPLENK